MCENKISKEETKEQARKDFEEGAFYFLMNEDTELFFVQFTSIDQNAPESQEELNQHL